MLRRALRRQIWPRLVRNEKSEFPHRMVKDETRGHHCIRAGQMARASRRCEPTTRRAAKRARSSVDDFGTFVQTDCGQSISPHLEGFGGLSRPVGDLTKDPERFRA